MNVSLVQSFAATFVEALRTLGFKEIGFGNAKKEEHYVPFGALTTTVKGAANQIRLTMTVSYDEQCAAAVAKAVLAKEPKGTKLDTSAALNKFCDDTCKTQKKKLSDESWIATFTPPATTKPADADVPDFAKRPFMRIPFRTEHGRITMIVGMVQM